MHAEPLAVSTPSILGGTWTILRARAQVARNTFWRGKLIRKILIVLLVVLLIGVSYALYRFSGFVVRGLQILAERDATRDLIAQLGSLDRIFAAVPSLTLTAFALPMLLSSVSFALSTLYLARDLEALLVTPVPVRSVFLARFLEGLAPTYAILFVLLAPALFGYGQALGYNWGFFVALVFVLLCLPFLPVSVGTLLTMLLVRVIPAKRLRDVITVIGGLFGLVMYIASQSLNRVMRNLVRPATAEQLLRFDIPALPTSWGARLLVAAGQGDLQNVILFGTGYALATIGLFAICIVLAERVYYHGLVNMAGTQGGRVRRRRFQASGPAIFRGPIGAIVRKDLRILPRDLQQLSQLLFPLAISAFWIWRLITDTELTSSEIGSSPTVVDYGLVITGIFVCLLITSHLGLTGLSREGKNYWVLHLAPIDPWTTLWAKWIVAWLPFGIVGTVFVALIGLLQQPSLGQLLQDWALFLLTGVGVAGITVGLGAAFPRFDWQQPKKMTSTRAGCIGSLLHFVYTAFMLGSVAGASFLAPRFGNWVYAAGWGAAITLTGLALWFPLMLGASRLRNLDV